MSESSATDLVDSSTSSSSDSDESWATAYESEFDLTLSDVDEDLLEAMRNFRVDEAPEAVIDEPGSASDDETSYSLSIGGSTPNWRDNHLLRFTSDVLIHNYRSEAARAQRAGTHVHATVKRHKVRSVKEWFVVVVGRPPGLYAAREVMAHVQGVSNAVYQGYPTREAAERAWRTAQQAGMIGSPEGLLPPDIVLHHMPAQSPNVPIPSPLSDTGRGRRFYVVYRGRFTGIFHSNLEAGLSVVGVAGNVHDSFSTYGSASRKFRGARERGEVQTLNA